MIIIRTAEDLARALSRPPDLELQPLLQAAADLLAAYEDFGLEDLAMFALVQPGDDPNDISQAIGWSLLDGEGVFSKPAELIDRYEQYWEITFVLSDDGFGLILFVPMDMGTNRELLGACERALTSFQQRGLP